MIKPIEILTSYLAWTLLLGYIFNLQTPPPTLPPPLDYSLFLLYRLNMAIYGFGHMIPSWKLLDPFHIGRGGCADSKHILKLKTMPNTRSISLTVWSPHHILIHQLFGVYREREKPSNPLFGKGSRSFWLGIIQYVQILDLLPKNQVPTPNTEAITCNP